MFNSSYQNLSFRQQIISANQSYPCPRCTSGMLETYGLTETFKCTSCERSFVALRGGRMLYPANRMGIKVAPTFWWDGLRWHWAGTTASTKQLFTIVAMFVLPVALAQLAFAFNLIADKPDWLNPALATALVSLLSMQAIYFLCWDFDFVSRSKERERKSPLADRPPSGN